MHKKIYLSPELEIKHITLSDVLSASAEYYSEVIDGPGDWGGDTPPTPDPDEGIEW